MSRHEQAGVLWFGLGIFLRLLVIGQPPVDDNSWIRQTETADAIQCWIVRGQPSWDAAVSWRVDLRARLLGFPSMWRDEEYQLCFESLKDFLSWPLILWGLMKRCGKRRFGCEKMFLMGILSSSKPTACTRGNIHNFQGLAI